MDFLKSQTADEMQSRRGIWRDVAIQLRNRTMPPVAISVESGSPFQAFNGALTGATLRVIPQRLVIQSWRSTKFNDGDPDSTLILVFIPEATNGRIDLVHLDVPAHNYQSVVEGWETHYWGPWRRYLAG